MKNMVVLVTLLAATFVSGCGTVKTALVEPRVSQVVDEGLRTLTTDENLERLRVLSEIPNLESASRDIVEASVEGALTGLSKEENQQRLSETVENLTGTLLHASATGLEQSLGPAIERQSKKILDTSLKTLLSEQVLRDSAALVEDVVRASSRAVMQEIEGSVGERFGPAVGRYLEHDILPAIARALEKDICPALSQTSRDVAREAALGLDEALDGSLGKAIQSQVEATLKAIREGSEETAKGLTGYLLVAVGILILGLAALAYYLRVYVRTLRGREEALELVTSSIKGFVGGSATLLAETVKSNGEGTSGGDSLREFLTSKQHLKIGGS